MPITIKETTEWTVELPGVPTWFKLVRHIPPNGIADRQILTADLSDAQLEEIADEWKKQLLALAKSKRSPE